MEIFWIYLITRLDEMKDFLGTGQGFFGVFFVLSVVAYAIFRFTTKTLKASEVDAADYDDKVAYRGKKVTVRGMWIFGILFGLFAIPNMLLPTTRDALVIAGGYGLTEAVKSEKFQTMFSKSTIVATSWLDEKLNPPKDEKKK